MSVFQWMSLTAMLFALLQPLGAVSAVAQSAPATGDLQIMLGNGAGGAVGGACYTVTDANGNTRSVCDDDGDGTAYLSALPPGSAFIAETSGPSGYYIADPGSGTVVENGVVTVNMTSYAIPVAPATAQEQPTDTPTQEPAATDTPTQEPTATDIPATETPTQEPAATDTPTQAVTETATTGPTVTETATTPAVTATTTDTATATATGAASPTATTPPKKARTAGFQAADAGDLFTISCIYDTTTNLSSFTFTLQKANPGDPDPDPLLIINFSPYDNNMNPVAPSVGHSYTTSFPNMPWRQLDVTFQRPDGVTGQASAKCNTSQNTTTITTVARTSDGTAIPNGSGVPMGTAIKDTALLAGNTINASGTATYKLYAGNACSGNPVFTQTVTVANGLIPDSPTFTPATPGVYNWQVTYNGDTLNKASTSACGSESLVVGKVSPSITTKMTDGGGSEIGHNATVPTGTQVRDLAILTGTTPNAGGTVTYNLYATSDCSGATVYSSSQPVTNGVATASGLFTPAMGTYNWQVVYSGDSLNNGVTSGCGTETFTIGKKTPKVTTTMINDAGGTIHDGDTVAIGTSAHDTATMSGATSDASGTVTYYLYAGDSCANPIATFGPYTVTNGALPNSGSQVFNTVGTYNWQAVYSGDGKNDGASSVCGSETMNIGKNSPSIKTVMKSGGNVLPQNGIVPLPATVSDSATLPGATANASGSVVYKLYKGSACDGGTLIFTSPAMTVVNGVVPDAPAQNITVGGTYNWVATYSGDGNNNGATGDCGDEQFFAGKGQGVITTQVKKTAGGNVNDGGKVPVGTSIYDTAKITGVTPNAGGTVTYKLYPGGTCAAGTEVFTSTVTMSNGSIPNSGAFIVTAADTYEWQVTYAGDANNEPVVSTCGAETVIVEVVKTSITTVTKDAGGNTIADNAGVLVPFSMYDTATLSGATANAGGSVTYNLYKNIDCKGTPFFTSGPHTVSNGVVPDSGVTPSLTDATIYNWQVVYSGDASNEKSTSGCGSETVFGQVQPSIATVMQYADGTVIAQGAQVNLGSSVRDTATLSNTTASAGGTVTYKLYPNADCSGTPIFTSTKTFSGGVVPPSDSTTVSYSGVYNWQAVYSGDNNNKPVTGACGDETFTVKSGTPTITTTMKTGSTTIPQGGSIVLPKSVKDTAVLSGVTNNAGGTVTYELFKSTDCSGTALFTSTKTVTNHIVPDSDAFSATAFGTYNWRVTYSGDANNAGAVSGCGQETFVGVETLNRTIQIDCSYNPGDGSSTFRVVVAKQATSAPDYDPALTMVVNPLAIDNTALPAITYHNYDSNVGPNNPNFIGQQWRSINVNATWPDGYTGTASAGCNSTKLQPAITTKMVDAKGGTVANGTVVLPGSQIGDTATMTGGTIDFGGSVTYKLYNSADCSGTPVFTDLQPILTPGVVPPSGLFTIVASGPYNWVVDYSGDSYNKPATSACNTEYFTAGAPDLKITKVADQGTVSAGDQIGFTITLTNSGTGVAKGAGITDTLPTNAGLNWVVDTANSSANCTITAGVLNCTARDLNPNDVIKVHITSVTTQATCGVVNNTASYSSTNAGTGSANASVTVNCADLKITKVADAATVNAGEQIGFTITLTNSGAGVAKGASITDTLPTNGGLSWVVDTANSSANCTITAGVLNCAARDLAKDGTIKVHITSVTTQATCGVVNNTASYSSTNAGTGSANASVTVNCPALKITKTADAGTVSAGDQIGYTITLTNSGPGVAKGAFITDTLPTNGGLNWSVDTANSSVNCQIASGKVTCDARDLAANGTIKVHIISPTTSATCGVVNNSATYGSTNGGGGETPVVPITVNCPDLKIAKTADNGTVNAGESIGFTVTLTNKGPGIARAVTLTDPLPANAGLNWSVDTANSSANCTITAGVLNCAARDLAANETITVHIVSPTTPATCGVVRNTASYGSTNGGTGTSNEATVTVNCPDVTVTKVADKATVSAGDQIGFTMVVTNNGPGVAKGVTLKDTLPATAGTSWAISPAVQGCSITAGVLNCSFGDMAAKATATVHIVSTTTPASCGPVNNMVRVDATNEAESAQGNNTANASVQVDCPNVVVKKTALTPSISAGDDLKFSIEVSNTGAGIARNVTLSDPLPAGIAWSVDNTQQCSITNGTLNCSFGDLASGAKVTVVVTGKTTAKNCGNVTNTAQVAATNEPESAKGDNSSTATATILCPDVTVLKTAANGTISAGDNATFSIKVSNIGAGIARDVRLLDVLPLGFAWQISPSVQGCAIILGTLSCSFGDMAPQASVTVTVTAPTAFAQCGTIRNTALVSATNEADKDKGNNLSSASIAINCSDLKLTKTPDQGTVSAGTTIGFTLSVTNKGDGEARNVVLTDVLPTAAGLSWTISPAVQGCSIANGTLTCDFGTLGKNVTKSVHITSTTTAATCGVVDNSATIRASNAPDAIASGSVTVNCPNVTIVKRPVSGTINSGDTMSFQIVVTNNGLGDAYGVKVVDPLPASVTNWTADNANCTIANGTMTCDFGTIPSGESRTVTVSGKATADVCGMVINKATVSATNEPDSAKGDNVAQAGVTVLCPDLQITKTAGNGTINAGDTASFTITVRNAGAGEAKNVTITDNLPAGIDWKVDPAVQGCSIDNGTLTCQVGTLASSATFSVTVTGKTDAADCGTLNNTASTAASNEPTDATGNNSASASIMVNCPDLKIEKSAANGTISAGDMASYTVKVTNLGPGTAYDVVMTDKLPAGVAWAISPAVAGCSITDGTLTCSVASLASGASFSVTVSGKTDAADCGTLNNTATTSASNEPRDKTGNNSASAAIVVNCSDVKVEKTAANGTINAGDMASYTVKVTNLGPGTAYDVVMTDKLPAGVAWAISPAVQGCSITDGTLTCTVASLAANGSFSVTVSGKTDAADCGTLNNTANVSASNEGSEAGGNNSASAAIVVNCPDLKIVKTAANGTINAGDNATFSMTVTNNGAGKAYDVKINDTLPAGISWSINPAVSGCAITDGKLTCSFAELAPGASVTVTVTGKTDATLCGPLNNTATTSASNEPKDKTGDNTSTATMQVNCPDLKIEKTAITGTINAGDTASFKIVVTNLGPGTAYDVKVSDKLPAGIDWKLDPAVENCAIADGTLTCSFGEMAAEASVTLIVSGKTDATVCGELSNTATTSASNEPKDKTGNNTSTATMQVNCPDLKIEKKAVKESISADDDAAFSIVVTNLGPGTAYDVKVTDKLPAGIDWTISPAVEGCSITDGTLNCSLDKLAMNATLTVTVTGKTDKTDCGTLTNTATTSASNEPQGSTGNNSSTATMQVNCPDLTVKKVATKATISAGDQAGFEITVTNNGKGDAYAVKVSDPLPAGIDWTINPAVEGCAIADGTLTCTFEKLAAGESKTITITGETDATNCGQLSNTVTVSAHNEPDDKTGDNSSTATMQINCPDVAVVKTADAPVIIAGDKVGFGITISNIGAGDAYGVTVTDKLPAGVDWAIDGGTATGCAIANGTLSCAFDKLAAGASVTVHISGQTAADACGQMTNTVNVAATNEAESATGNNRSYATVTIACDNVVITKYLCVTDNDHASVEFVVTTPRGDDGSRGCAIGPGVHFTITGDNLSAPLHRQTHANGQINLTLLSGTYTLTEDSTGASVQFEVVTNQPTLINVYNLTPEPTVEVTINKFWCKTVENGVLMTVNKTAGLKGCTPGATIVQLDGGAPFRINDNGTITILVTVGEHTLSEPSANASIGFTATPGEPVTIRIYNQITEPKPGPSFPNTGSGIGGGGDTNDALILAMLLASLITLAGGTYLVRRRESDERDAA